MQNMVTFKCLCRSIEHILNKKKLHHNQRSVFILFSTIQQKVNK